MREWECVFFLWRSQTSTQLFLSAVCLSHNECKGNLASWRRVWNLADICRARFFSLDHHAKITRSWIRTAGSVARELSSHLVTKQQHLMKAFAALPEKYAATHTHECALCESVYISCNRFMANAGSAERAFRNLAVLYFYGLHGTRVEAARSSAVGYVSCFVRRPEKVKGGENGDKFYMSLLPRRIIITIIKKPDQTRTQSCSQESSQATRPENFLI